MRLYLGKPAFIHRAQGLRYPPGPEQSTIQFHWHHDVEEKRFKIMVVLTDVGDEDQYMGYVLGSHRLFHPYPMFFSNDCGLDYCRQHLPQIEIFRGTGKAGDIIIFDSNGAHCGNRSASARVRDVFIVAYTADKTYTWGADIDRTIFSRLSLTRSKSLRVDARCTEDVGIAAHGEARRPGRSASRASRAGCSYCGKLQECSSPAPLSGGTPRSRPRAPRAPAPGLPPAPAGGPSSRRTAGRSRPRPRPAAPRPGRDSRPRPAPGPGRR